MEQLDLSAIYEYSEKQYPGQMRDTRLQKIREAVSAPEAEAREKARNREKENHEGSGRSHVPGVDGPSQTNPSDRGQRNFTDPDSRIIKVSSTKPFEQCYNCQTAVDEESQVIVGTR